MERALDAAGDARDIAKDVLRGLPDADTSEDEITARHDVPSIHVHMHSEHDADSEPPAKKQLKAGLIALGSGIGLALITAVAALLQRCSR